MQFVLSWEHSHGYSVVGSHKESQTESCAAKTEKRNHTNTLQVVENAPKGWGHPQQNSAGTFLGSCWWPQFGHRTEGDTHCWKLVLYLAVGTTLSKNADKDLVSITDDGFGKTMKAIYLSQENGCQRRGREVSGQGDEVSIFWKAINNYSNHGFPLNRG